MSVTLDSRLNGVLGGKTAAALERAHGMHTVADVLAHYPRRYARRGELTPIDSLVVGEQVTIVAQVKYARERRMQKRPGSILEVVITDGHGDLQLTFFNQHWRADELAPGRRGVFSGKIGEYRGGMQLAHPDYEMFGKGSRPEGALGAQPGAATGEPEDIPAEAQGFADQLIPIYPATSTMPSWMFARIVDQTLTVLEDPPDPLPPALRESERLLPFRTALERIHRPQSQRDIDDATRTLRAQEALVLQTALLQQRQEVRELRATAREAGALLARFDAELPFALTPDQQAVGDRIAADLVGAWPMNRLVQGEVGSGKTLVALRAMLQVAQSGGQSALIAPTEVLAAQHLRSITRMLGPRLAPELMPTLLTGQMSVPERRKAALRVASGQSLIVVGTHALLTDKTTFADLGLVVVDEQHRFGVEQRESLRAKGTSPHALVLTATPIPRTVAMTVFGDLDVSVIRSMPPGRAGIESYVVPVTESRGALERVFNRAAAEIAQGHQVFVVCSAIDTDTEQAEDDAGSVPEPAQENAPKPWGVVQLARLLPTHPLLREARIEMLHGRMTADEKDRVMRAFAAGDIDLLVATTVVEVGVDVPNASAMIVMDADRFGVSQLHQLRGRVGRGSIPAICLLVTAAHPGSAARARVDAVAATGDGFALAEIDLELRGEGDVLGAAQSGVRSSLRLLRVVADADLIAWARRVAEGILEQDPSLSGHAGLAAAINRRLDEDARAALAKN